MNNFWAALAMWLFGSLCGAVILDRILKYRHKNDIKIIPRRMIGDRVYEVKLIIQMIGDKLQHTAQGAPIIQIHEHPDKDSFDLDMAFGTSCFAPMIKINDCIDSINSTLSKDIRVFKFSLFFTTNEGIEKILRDHKYGLVFVPNMVNPHDDLCPMLIDKYGNIQVTKFSPNYESNSSNLYALIGNKVITGSVSLNTITTDKDLQVIDPFEFFEELGADPKILKKYRGRA